MTNKAILATLALMALMAGASATGVCDGTKTSIGSPVEGLGLRVTTTQNIMDGYLNTLVISIQNLEDAPKNITYYDFKCRCWQDEGSPLGICHYYWSPGDESTMCLASEKNISLAPYETRNLSVSVSQYGNQICGSLQLDFAIKKVNDYVIPSESGYGKLVAWSVTDLCTDCSTECDGKLRVIKFNDSDGDGVRDAGENGLEGVQFTATGTASGTRYTNSSGEIYVSGLAAGSYTVTETLPAGWTNTTPLSQTVLIECCHTKTLLYGDMRTTTTSSTTTTVPNAPEFGGAGMGSVAAMLLIAPAFAYLLVRRKE